MKDINPPPTSFWGLFDEIGRAVGKTARYALRMFERTSWPAILLGCVLLALILTVLPLAIMLFALFLLFKLVAGACAGKPQRKAPFQQPPQ